MLAFAASLLYYPIVAFLLAALLLRRPGLERKREAALVWAALLLALRVAAWLLARRRIPDALFVVPLAAAGAFAWAARRILLPLRLRCARCGARRSAVEVLAGADDLCGRCAGRRLERGQGRAGSPR